MPTEVTVAAIRAELLYSPDCPHAERAGELLGRILTEEGIAVPVERVRVVDLDGAVALGYPGSPTIRLDGIDVEPMAGEVGLACRLYRRPDGRTDTVPAEESVRAAVRARARPSAPRGSR